MQCRNLSTDLNQVLRHAFEVIAHFKILNLFKPVEVRQLFRDPSELFRGIVVVKVMGAVNQVLKFSKFFTGLFLDNGARIALVIAIEIVQMIRCKLKIGNNQVHIMRIFVAHTIDEPS